MARRTRLFGPKSRRQKADEKTAPEKPQDLQQEPMTNVMVAAGLLRQSAAMLRAIGEANPDLEPRYSTLAGAYEAVAGLTELDPLGPAPDGVEDLLNEL